MKLSRILKKGLKGDDVAFLQKILIDRKLLNAKPDGDFGSVTEIAVKKYQKSLGLKDDGIVGPFTWSKLTESVVLESTPKPKTVITSNTTPVAPVTKPSGSGVVAKTSKPFPHTPAYSVGKNTFVYDNILEKGEYYTTKSVKKTIYLHHTSGGSNPINTISGWAKDGKPNQPLVISTAYVIGRESRDGDTTFDGKIFRAFDDAHWGYHLGLKHKDNKEFNAQAIGIEICNYGYLVKDKRGKYINYVGGEIMPSNVQELERPFLGIS